MTEWVAAVASALAFGFALAGILFFIRGADDDDWDEPGHWGV